MNTNGLRGCYQSSPLKEASFGAAVHFLPGARLRERIEQLEDDARSLPNALTQADGLLVIKDMHEITQQPELLVRLSRLFGPEVENYQDTPTPVRLIHEDAPQIIKISNLPPMNFDVPVRPEPPLTADGKIPVQFPHRKGWHTDQSFRRPPPDISLFYAMQPSPKGQGQTLYANGIAAYAALSAEQKRQLDGLEAVHAIPWTGRGEDAVRRGDIPKVLEPHQSSQKQPVVRTHPESKKRALYLCEEGQLDWILGPIDGMTPGPGGDGAELIYELMEHYTQPVFTYVHDWDEGDLVIHDNRNLVHSATWFDAENHGRIMWRTTVMGNPGEEYTGENQSWVPSSGTAIGMLDY
jgi:taurine dioxygenase